MRVFFGCLVVAVMANLPVFGQERLLMYPSFGGVHFEYEKDTAVFQVTPKQVSQILFIQPEALAEFKKARRSSTLSGILGFAGAGLLIIPTATAIAGGDPEWTMAAGGAALIAGSIPFAINYRKKAARALDLFNERQGRASLQPRLHFYAVGNGFKLVFRF